VLFFCLLLLIFSQIYFLSQYQHTPNFFYVFYFSISVPTRPQQRRGRRTWCRGLLLLTRMVAALPRADRGSKRGMC
jgi:hypothetical protein